MHQTTSSPLMASPSLILWPTQEDSPTPPPNPKPKPKRAPKSSSSSKRVPQRGLGVAQLEQIRLQSKVPSIVDRRGGGGELQPFPVDLPSVYGAPVAYAGPGGQICYVPQLRVGYGPPPSAIRSVLHEQYAIDRERVRVGGAAPVELPSNQRADAVNCASDRCEFCARKKRVLSEDHLRFDVGNAVINHHLAMEEGRRNLGCFERMGMFAREIREYDFFPHSSIGGGSGGGGGGLEFEGRAAGGPSSSPTGPATFLDLSLKLS